MIALTSGDMDKSRGERTKIRYGLTESQGILISLRTTKAGYAENKEALSRTKKKASAYFAWTANWKLTPDFFFTPPRRFASEFRSEPCGWSSHSLFITLVILNRIWGGIPQTGHNGRRLGLSVLDQNPIFFPLNFFFIFFHGRSVQAAMCCFGQSVV